LGALVQGLLPGREGGSRQRAKALGFAKDGAEVLGGLDRIGLNAERITEG
jgi:hypothetical protein